MSSPQSFKTVDAPDLQRPVAPINFAQGLEEFYKSRAMNAFAGGIPKKDDGSPDFQAILAKTFQAGGVPAVQGLLPYLYMTGQVNSGATQGATNTINTGGESAGAGAPAGGAGGSASQQPPGAGAAAGPDPNDPQNAGYFEHFKGGIAQAETGGERDPYNSVISTGTGHKVYGKFQVYDDNIPQWTQEALGRRMTPKEFLADPKAQEAVAHAKLGEYVQKYGYAGAARAWIAGEAGMNNPRAADKFGSTPTGYAAKVLRYASASRAAAGATAQAPPVAASASAAASASDAAGSRPAITGGQPSPSTTRQQVSTGTATQPGMAAPQTAGAEGRSIPTTGKIETAQQQQTTPPPPRQPLPPNQTTTPPQPVAHQPLPPIDMATNDPTIASLKQKQNNLIGAMNELAQQQGLMHFNDTKIANGKIQIENIQKAIESKSATLNKPYEKENEARAAGFANARTYQQFQDADKKAIEESAKQQGSINGAANAIGLDLLPHIQNGKALLNAPGLMTGYGAETVLEFNRAKQYFGDRNAAVQQEAFQKTTNAMQLGAVQMQKFLAGMGGQQSSRIFAHQIDMVQKSSASLGNTIAGNRFLMTGAERMANSILHVQQMATDYLDQAKGGKPFLDQNFNQQVADYLRTNPLMTEQEAKDPSKFLSAPEIPKGLKGDALIKWMHDMHVKEGDPVRASNFDQISPEQRERGGYIKALKLTVPVKTYGANP